MQKEKSTSKVKANYYNTPNPIDGTIRCNHINIKIDTAYICIEGPRPKTITTNIIRIAEDQFMCMSCGKIFTLLQVIKLNMWILQHEDHFCRTMLSEKQEEVLFNGIKPVRFKPQHFNPQIGTHWILSANENAYLFLPPLEVFSGIEDDKIAPKDDMDCFKSLFPDIDCTPEYFFKKCSKTIHDDKRREDYPLYNNSFDYNLIYQKHIYGN